MRAAVAAFTSVLAWPVFVVADDFKCTTGAYTGPELLSVENIDSIEACKEYCRKIDTCVSLTWHLQGCSLFAKDAVLDSSAVKSETCTRAAQLKFECKTGEAFASTASSFSIGDVPSVGECKQQCSGFGTICKGFNYVKLTCEIMDSVAEYVADADESTVSCIVQQAPTAQKQFDCQEDMTVVGEEFLSFSNVRHVSECNKFCVSISTCTGYTIADGECILKEGNPAFKRALGSVACVEKNTMVVPGHGAVLDTVGMQSVESSEGYTCKVGAYNEGTLSSIYNIESSRQCAEHCTSLSGCAISVFNPLEGRCVLKSMFARPTSTAAKSVACVSTELTQVQGFHCTVELSLSSGTLSLISDLSFDNCREQCALMRECTAVQYSAGTRTCELMGSDASIENKKPDTTVCARQSTLPPIKFASVDSRTAQSLSEDETLLPFVRVKFGFHIPKMSLAVFQSYNMTVEEDDSTTTIWVSILVEVPVGIQPSLYLATAFNQLAAELNTQNNILLMKLNPMLQHLGLEHLSPGANGRWTLLDEGYLWQPSACKLLVLPLVFDPVHTDLETDGARRALARSIGWDLGIPASYVSVKEVLHCEDELATLNCKSVWTAAEPDTQVQDSRRGEVQSCPTVLSKKVILTIKVCDNTTIVDYCKNVTSVLPCDSGNSINVTGHSYGLLSCGSCEEEESAPVDDYAATSSLFTGRHLLHSDSDLTAGAEAAASSLKPHNARTCSTGWQTESWGVMTEGFNIVGDAVKSGTLQECVDACSHDSGCFAFTRNKTVADEEPAECWLKRTVLPTKGNQVSRNGLMTYVVSCPSYTRDCHWNYLDKYDLSSESHFSVTTSTAPECKELCEIMGDCEAVSYDRSTGLCHFVQELEDMNTGIVEDSDIVTAVCYHTTSKSPCDEGYCGVLPSQGCFPLQGEEHRCSCAEGFDCVENCVELTKPHVCERTTSLQTLLTEAVSIILNIDHAGLVIESVESVSVNDSDAVPTPDQNEVVVSSMKVDIPTTHLFSLTLDKLSSDELFVEENGRTKLQLLRLQAAQGFGVSESDLTVRHVCQVTPDMSIVDCVDEDGKETSEELHKKPVIKVTPTRDSAHAVDWCLTDEPTFLASPKTPVEVESLVFRAGGDMLETRSYWVGATCDENCDQAENWLWRDGTPVDWMSLGYSNGGTGLLTASATCAVLKWDVETLRWGLLPVNCDAKGNYPVCVNTETLSGESSDACSAEKSCDLKVTFALSLTHTRNVYFVTLPDGTRKQYHPVDDLPARARIVSKDGSIKGFVSADGKTNVVPYPPIDTTTNAAVQQKFSGYTYISEAIYSLVHDRSAAWASAVGVESTVSAACHEATIQQHVACDAYCTLADSVMIRRTSCQGAPPCLNSICNGHGYVKGFMGFCQCVCDVGFGGTNCGQCSAGFAGFPQCAASGSAADPVFEVIFMNFEKRMGVLKNGYDNLVKDIEESLGHMVGSYSVRYICPISVCAEGSCKEPVATWTQARRSQCLKKGVDFATGTTSERGFHVLAEEESFVEVQLQYNDKYSVKDKSETSSEMHNTLSHYVGQTEGTYGQFVLTQVSSVYGPSVKVDSSLASPLDSSASVGGAAVELTGDEGTDTLVVTLLAVGVFLICCCFAVFAYWRHRRNQKKKAKTDDLLKYDEALPEDFVTIYKDPQEPMGILWDDHTLMVGVCDNSPAASYEVDRFRNRRIAKVNGMKVSTLRDIREAVEGQSVVTLAFEPRFSAIVVRVGSRMEDFYEQEFMSVFSERIGRALNLLDFTEMDMDLQSVIDRPEKGELLLTIKLLGLTSDQVANIVAMCVTPGEAIRAGLPIVGAYLATAKLSQVTPPLWVCAQWVQEASQASGCYLQLPGVTEGGHPVWQHTPADHWLYSTPSGHWMIVDDKTLIGSDLQDGYVLRSTTPHQGRSPTSSGPWQTPLRPDDNILVMDEEPRAHDEFVVGQKVVFPTEVDLADGSVINKLSEGLVMGEAGDLVRVCLLNEKYDIVTVSPDNIDSPDGPCVEVFQDGGWQEARIVKVRGSQVKIHFDCGLCQDRWYDKDADKKVLRIQKPTVFAIGDRVHLADAPEAVQEEGCLGSGEIGVVVACGDLGQAKPYLVEGPYELAWYSGGHLAHFTPTGDELSTDPFGDQFVSDDAAGEMEESAVRAMTERRDSAGVIHRRVPPSSD